MAGVVDFYQYKYSRDNYYVDLFFTVDKIKAVKKAIEDGFEDLFINNEYKYAYQKLKVIFEDSIKDERHGFARLRLNKCYVKYLKNLYFSYYNKEESRAVKEIILYMQFYMDEDYDSISRFVSLNEKTKLSILSYI